MRPSSANTRGELVALSPGDGGPDRPIPPHAEPQLLPPQTLRLVPFCFWVGRAATATQAGLAAAPASLRHAISAHLAALGWPAAQPLRWAITAVDPLRGLQLEGLAVMDGIPSSHGQPHA